MTLPQNTESPCHPRSFSLPSRPPPRLRVPHLEEHLFRLTSSEAASTSASLSSLIYSLVGLKDLYDCLDELLLLQPNQQSIVLSCRVDDQLDASLRLLDVCGSAKEALLQMKECIQGIQLLLRRRGRGELNAANQVSRYMSSRKKIKQVVKESLKDTKTVLERCSFGDHVTKNDASVSTVGILRQVEVVTARIFGSLLSYIASPKAQPKKSRWSVVSKLLLHSKDESASTSEFDKLDVSMPLFGSPTRKGGLNIVEAEKLRSKMVKLEAEIQELDEVLECLFRRLVKTRAILLNILSA